MALPQVDDVSDFHCVTTWSRLDNHWRGVRFSTLAELAVPKENAAWVLCTGYDSDITSGEPYTTNLPLPRAIEDDVLLVHTWEGRPLPREHGGWRVDFEGRAPREHFPGARGKSFRAWAIRLLLPVIEGQL